MASLTPACGTRLRSSLGLAEGMSPQRARLLFSYEAHTISRICPGRYFAEATLFINAACVLHVFDIGPPLGDDGRPIKIEHVQTDSLVSYASS